MSPTSPHICFCLWLHTFFLLTPFYRTCLPTNEKHYERGCTTTCIVRIKSRHVWQRPVVPVLHTHLQLRRPRRHQASAASTQGLLWQLEESINADDRVQLHRRGDFDTLTSDALRRNMKSTRRLNFSSSVETNISPMFSPEDRSTVQGERILNLCLASTGSRRLRRIFSDPNIWNLFCYVMSDVLLFYCLRPVVWSYESFPRGTAKSSTPCRSRRVRWLERYRTLIQKISQISHVKKRSIQKYEISKSI